MSDTCIENYQIFDNEKDDMLVFVDDEDGNGKWCIAINLAGYNSSTMIHELAHIISLNQSQVVLEYTTCAYLKLDEGCARKDSYINTFTDIFWKNKSKKNMQFVTEYASTNEVEDFAESFAFLVLEKEGVNTDPMRDRKTNFFNRFADLKEIRSDMRNVLVKEILRARKMGR